MIAPTRRERPYPGLHRARALAAFGQRAKAGWRPSPSNYRPLRRSRHRTVEEGSAVGNERRTESVGHRGSPGVARRAFWRTESRKSGGTPSGPQPAALVREPALERDRTTQAVSADRPLAASLRETEPPMGKSADCHECRPGPRPENGAPALSPSGGRPRDADLRAAERRWQHLRLPSPPGVGDQRTAVRSPRRQATAEGLGEAPVRSPSRTRRDAPVATSHPGTRRRGGDAKSRTPSWP